MRTITLELLRHGPAHNQLLSPLTPYHALCGNHSGATIHVPFEHNQFLHRLRALSYEIAPEAVTFQLGDTARVLSDVLALVPGLTAEFARRGDQDEPVHLRLITAASELALLPFELALSPPGHPGAGQPLLLQSEAAVCLTRDTSRIVEASEPWPNRPRILFISGAPDDSSVPVDAHLLALRRAIDPWVRQVPSDKKGALGTTLRTGQRAGVDDLLTMLPAASVVDIEEACANGDYTHVHILAHGVVLPVGHDTRFGLRLRGDDRADEVDVVSGERLAAALAAMRRPSASDVVRAPIVTLAACHGSNVGTVAGAGASIAHALSSRGCPLVVASQFPLSYLGSVKMVEVLYEGLLWGIDPRLVLIDLRRRLFADFPEQHDWASLTAYACLPAKLDEQLREMQIDRAFEALEVALDFADFATRGALEATIDHETLDASRRRMQLETNRLQALLDANVSKRQRSRIFGYLASMGKRDAELLFLGSDREPENETLVLNKLQRAKACYKLAFEHDPANSWAIVQYLSLHAVLTAAPHRADHEGADEIVGLLRLADTVSRFDLKGDTERRIWALGNLMELALLSKLLPTDIYVDPADASRAAEQWGRELLGLAGLDGFWVYSTRRQMERYTGWYTRLAPNLLPPEAKTLADRLIRTLATGS